MSGGWLEKIVAHRNCHLDSVKSCVVREIHVSSAKTQVDGAKITLTDVGSDKGLADRARKYAAVPDDEWEQELGDWRDRVEELRRRGVSVWETADYDRPARFHAE
jgi:hypothetical protein